MVPDDEYPPSLWQTVALVAVLVVVVGLAAAGVVAVFQWLL